MHYTDNVGTIGLIRTIAKMKFYGECYADLGRSSYRVRVTSVKCH